ncbi:unnamed protein product [Absidia cylindrospora]
MALAKHVQHLHIHVSMNDTHLLLLTYYLPMLKTLELRMANGITNACILGLAQYCPLLQSLSIQSGRITGQAIVSISQHFPHLTSLALENCAGLTPKHGAFGSLQACTSLRKLTLDIGAFHKTLHHEPTLMGQLIGDLLALSSLTTLSLVVRPIRGFGSILLNRMFFRNHHQPATATATTATATTTTTSAAPQTITVAAATAAMRSCWPDLTDFSLGECRGVPDRRMGIFLQTHPKLTKLTLDNNDFTDTLLGGIPNYLPRIESVSLTGADKISADDIRKLVLDCPTLSCLNIKGRENMRRRFPEVDYSCFSITKKTRAIVDDDDDDFYAIFFRPTIDDDPNKYLMHLDRRNIARIRKRS